MDSRDTERGFRTSDIIHEYENMDPNEDYDAFNDDTFGNNAETWTKEDHDQLVGAHAIEVRQIIFLRLRSCLRNIRYKNSENNSVICYLL